jgi:outer membrane protein OmpA-like peptidoglycan-associated protein
LWMGDQVREADHVLVIASAVYRERAEGRADAGTGRGVQWEARLIRDAFYADQGALDRFVPVVLPGQSVEGVPDFLGPATSTVYTVRNFTKSGAEELLRFLLGQPAETEPPLGLAPTFATREHLISSTSTELRADSALDHGLGSVTVGRGVTTGATADQVVAANATTRPTLPAEANDPNSTVRRRRRRLGTLFGSAGALVLTITIIVSTMNLGTGTTPVTRLVWIAEKTTRAPGLMPQSLRDRVLQMASGSAGTLEGYVVGEHSQHVASVSLIPDVRGDTTQFNNAINDRLAAFLARIDDVAVGDSGFSLYSSLQVMADEQTRSEGRVEVWLSTTVLTGSVDPLSVSQLVAADPKAAVQQLLKGALGKLDLSRVNLHPVMLTPIGDLQEALTPASEEWRKSFLIELASGLGAQVAQPLHDSTTIRAWSAASTVLPVLPIKDPTPHIDPTASTVRLDTVAFAPDTAMLVNPDDSRRAVAGIVDASRRDPEHFVIDVAGYSAAFGSPDNARFLAYQRAKAIADLLVNQGVSRDHITAHGFGYDQRADPNSDPRSSNQRVVLIKLLPKA